MLKVSWINHKKPDMDRIHKLLEPSIASNQLSNYGPMVKRLELLLTEKLGLDKEQYVAIAAASGTAALHGLAAGLSIYYKNNHKYATQAFSFPSSAQGVLANSIIVDVDAELGPDLSQVIVEEVDGLIVTNLFGHCPNLLRYLQWAEKYDKILLFDSATAPLTKYKDKSVLCYGDGSAVSLHHTKPIGFGEGGLIVCRKRYEAAIRRAINFGFKIEKGHVTWHFMGSNYKMSDIPAAYICDYIERNLAQMIDTHLKLYAYFLSQVKKKKLAIIPFPNYSDSTPFVSCIPVFLRKPVSGDMLHTIELHNITSRKYYTPLKSLPRSQKFFEQIVCLPCHIDMDQSTIDLYIKILSQLSTEE